MSWKESVSGCSMSMRSVPEVWITTDKYGYAATEENALVYGGWTLSEDASTTPDGYAGLKEAKIKIAENGVTLKYVVTNDIQDAQVRILKKDAETSKMIPLSGAQFQILDQNGDALKMPDNRDFTKVDGCIYHKRDRASSA